MVKTDHRSDRCESRTRNSGYMRQKKETLKKSVPGKKVRKVKSPDFWRPDIQSPTVYKVINRMAS